MTIQHIVKVLFFLSVAWTISHIYQKNTSMSVNKVISTPEYNENDETVNAKIPVLIINNCTNCSLEIEEAKRRIVTYSRKKLFHVFEGRLGNQLFQYASLPGIASSNDMIDCFHDNPLVPFFDDVESHACIQKENIPVLNENGDYAIYQQFRINHDAILSGFLQSYRYFQKNVRDIIQIKTEFRTQAKNILGTLTEGVKVAIHIRKNHSALDYLRLPGVSYYQKAMEYISSLHNAVTFVIVSDDVQWCQKQPFLNSSNVRSCLPHLFPSSFILLCFRLVYRNPPP